MDRAARHHSYSSSLYTRNDLVHGWLARRSAFFATLHLGPSGILSINFTRLFLFVLLIFASMSTSHHVSIPTNSLTCIVALVHHRNITDTLRQLRCNVFMCFRSWQRPSKDLQDTPKAFHAIVLNHHLQGVMYTMLTTFLQKLTFYHTLLIIQSYYTDGEVA